MIDYTSGRNLLTNSHTEWKYGTCNNGVYGGGSTRISPSVHNTTIPVAPSEPMSFHVSDETGVNGQIWYVGIHQLDADLNFLNDSGWRRCPYQFTTLENTAYVRLVVRNYSSFSVDDTNMSIDDALDALGDTLGFMLQYGDPTEWRPAPEDISNYEGGVELMILARDSLTLFHQKDITAVHWFYLLQSSTAAAPSKPTAAQAAAFINNGTLPGNWKKAEPVYTEGSTNSLYIVELTRFSDDTGEWSEVSLSSSYEAAKLAYNKASQAYEAATPIETRTYSGLIGSANDAANASFYYAKIHPTNFTVNWKVRFKIVVKVPEAYTQTVDIQFGGYGSTFSSYDAYVTRTGSIGMYFVNLYRATQAGINSNHKGHAVGFGLRSSTNPTNSSYARTIYVELLEVENCTVSFLDTAVKYASMDGTGPTNYYGLSEMGVATAGQNATNNSNTSYTQYGNAVKAGAFGVKRYTLLMQDSKETWVSFVNEANNTGTNKTVSTGGHLLGKLLYSAGGAEYAAGANTSTVYDAYQFDFRYSANITTSSLTAHKPVYLVGTMDNNGLFHLDTTTWWTQTIPGSADGKTYIYIGQAYSGYQIWLATENPAYQYYEGSFMKIEDIQTEKAAKTATNYLTVIDGTSGISVHDAGDTDNFANLSSDGMRVYKDGKKVAEFGENVKIGKDGEHSMKIYPNSMAISDAMGADLFSVDTEGEARSVEVNEKSTGVTNTFAGRSTNYESTLAKSVSNGSTIKVNVELRTSSQSSYSNWSVIKGTTYTNEIDGMLALTYDGQYKFTFTFQNDYSGYIIINVIATTTAPTPTYTLGTRRDDFDKGPFSTAIGKSLIADGENQLVVGNYNVPDPTKKVIIGNGSSSLRVNILTVDEYGNLKCNNIGATWSNTASKQITTAGIDTFIDGASINLPAGVYVITGTWVFETGASSGTKNMEVRLTNSSNTIIGTARQRILAAANNYAILQATFVGELDAGTYKVRGSCSMKTNAAGSTEIRAVRVC